MEEKFEITYHVYEGRGKKRTCKETVKTYVRLSLDEVKALHVGDRVDFLSRQGAIKQVTVTSVKTWKTRQDVRIGLKYGLYEYSYAECNVDKENDLQSWHGEILVKEQENETI
jgi:hypothetical protein